MCCVVCVCVHACVRACVCYIREFVLLTGDKILKESKEDIVEPLEIREDELLTVHSQEYLNSLKVSPTHFTLHNIYYQSSYNVALITEVALVAIVPNFVLKRKLLTPFREQTGELY